MLMSFFAWVDQDVPCGMSKLYSLTLIPTILFIYFHFDSDNADDDNIN